jgi:hypothetical protein
MNEHEFEHLEHLLSTRILPGPPATVRAAVLAEVRQELSASRWDWWLARVAGMLLVVGLGMNAALSISPSRTKPMAVARVPNPASLAQVAASVAESTDAQTGRRFAIELAALAGWTLSREDFATIDAAVKTSWSPGAFGKKG